MEKHVDYPLYHIAAMVFRNLGGSRIAEDFSKVLPSEVMERIDASDSAFKIKRGNRKVAITPYENRLILVLAAYLSLFSNDEKFKKCVNYLNKDYENCGSFACTVDLKWVAKLLTNRSDLKSVKNVRKHLDDLSSKRQVIAFTVKTASGNKTFFYDTFLFQINDGLLISDKDDVDFCKVNISFGKFFLWKYARQYSVVPGPLFDIMGKKKSGTDTAIFFALLNTLLYNWSYSIAKYNHAEDNLSKEIKSQDKKLKSSAFKKELLRRKKESLTFSEELDYFVMRSGSSSYTTQRHKDRLKKGIDRAIEVFKQINLISDCKKINDGGKVKLQFLYEPTYGHAPIMLSQKR